MADRMLAHDLDITIVCDGRRAAIAASRDLLTRDSAAGLGQAKMNIDVGRPTMGDFDKTLAHEKGEQVFEDGDGQSVALRQVTEARLSVEEGGLEYEAAEKDGGQPRIVDRPWRAKQEPRCFGETFARRSCLM
jgi:hypothetical protein